MKRKLILISLLVLSVWIVKADEAVRFSASAPSTVILDKPFQLAFTINATGKEFRAPEINNFDVLAGPFESHSSSIQIINGKTTSAVAVTYTYTLQAQKTGTFSIGSASIYIGMQKYTSNGATIKVLPADAAGSPKAQSNSASSSAASISNDNIFIRTNVSKTNVYEQEAILVTYKLYTLVDVVQFTNAKLPDFNGFMKQDLDQNKNAQLSYENYNGKNYGTIVLSQVLLYPQHAGVIEIGKGNFEAVIRVQNKNTVRSIFDDFFDSYTNVTKSIVAPASRITVNMLPANKPAAYNGTVGRFTLNSSISSTNTKTNDAITLKVNIVGSGNMKLIKNPEIKFPEGFEVYDPKVTNNFKTSTAGVTGSKTIEYLFIPRHSGNFEIPASEFSYFDIQDKKYKTLVIPAYKLDIKKGEGGETSTVSTNYVDKEDVKQLGKDIRYIHTDQYEISKEQEPLFGTVTSWLIYLIPLFISLILFIFFSKKIKDNADVKMVKNKKANKIALKRLKLAQKFLNEGKKDSFYEEVLKACWTYLSDKLSIPVAELTKERVNLELTKRDVEPTIINQFVEILNTCEFARFAPNSGQQEMGNLFEDTIQVISKLELVKSK